MHPVQPDEPACIGLLNAIAVGERRGGELLSAWACATTDDGVRAVLETVAIREHEHGAAFTKRLCELGFQVREKPGQRFVSDLALARSAASDREKFERLLRYHETPAGDPLGDLFADTSIDPETGALLGRFIAEERDSERRLRACYATLAGASNPGEPGLLDDLAGRLDRLTATLTALRSLRSSA